MEKISAEQYRTLFTDPDTAGRARSGDTRASRALAAALDIRKFEIELYWKRATYFWAFIAAAFAGYGLTYKASDPSQAWLSLLFSALGLVFAFSWFLVNRGSKFWQNNWERHVDLLEEITLGPLYTVVAVNSETRWLTAADRFSVTKINQLLSFFITVVWLVLFMKSLCPVSTALEPDWSKVSLALLTPIALCALWKYGQRDSWHGKSTLIKRTFDIET